MDGSIIVAMSEGLWQEPSQASVVGGFQGDHLVSYMLLSFWST